MIFNYRKDKENVNPTIGCIVLTNPIFFKREDWIKTPEDWSNSIVQGKSYNTDEVVGDRIWEIVKVLLQRYFLPNEYDGQKSQLILEEAESPAYGNSILQKVRL
jgi:putative restriction endonuclease